jgi:hypothetical protein
MWFYYRRTLRRGGRMSNQQFISMLKKWSQTKDLSLANDICTYLADLYKIENIVLNEDKDD